MSELDNDPSSLHIIEKIKVLAVEDDRNFRLMLQECMRGLDGLSIEKIFASDAKSGLKKCFEEKPDLVLLDIHLPDGNGLDLITPILQITPQTGIIMVTGSKSSVDVNTAKKLGAIGYILKPYTRKKIEEAFHVFLTYKEQQQQKPESNATSLSPDEFMEKLDFFIPDNDEMETQEIHEEKEPKRPSIKETLSDWNVLFADSYLSNLESAERHLNKVCKNVDLAASAKEFEQYTSQNSYQCIFVDPLFPDGNGYLLVNELKNRYRKEVIKPYIIALMRNSEEVENKRWLEAGMNDYLMKPCSFKDIKDKLGKYARIYLKEINEDYIA